MYFNFAEYFFNVNNRKFWISRVQFIAIKGPSWSWTWIYNYICNQCISPLELWVQILIRRGVLGSTLCDNFCQWLVTARWFSPGTPVSSTNKTDRHNITEILLKVALDTITLALTPDINQRMKVTYYF